MSKFWFKEFDVSKQLPLDWMVQISKVATELAASKTLTSSSVTSRELTNKEKISVLTVGGAKVKQNLPWLFDLYEGLFKSIAQSISNEPVSTASDIRYAINLNLQIGSTMRYECHVDSNPLEGLLYVSTHPMGSGGELVVSNDLNAKGTDAIKKNATKIYPRAGHLVFFDARNHPHYVATLTDQTDVRIVVAMNYYTPSCPESARPKDLNQHLGIE